jgi:hypothetical protein
MFGRDTEILGEPAYGKSIAAIRDQQPDAFTERSVQARARGLMRREEPS